MERGEGVERGGERCRSSGRDARRVCCRTTYRLGGEKVILPHAAAVGGGVGEVESDLLVCRAGEAEGVVFVRVRRRAAGAPLSTAERCVWW